MDDTDKYSVIPVLLLIPRYVSKGGTAEGDANLGVGRWAQEGSLKSETKDDCFALVQAGNLVAVNEVIEMKLTY